MKVFLKSPLCMELRCFCSLLCFCAGPLQSATTFILTLFTLTLRSPREGEPSGLLSEPEGVLAGDAHWLLGHPVSSEKREPHETVNVSQVT